MGDINPKGRSSTTRIVGDDEVHAADVLLEGGIRKLQTNATATIESLFGEVIFPYTWIEITAIGSNGDTIRIQIPDDSVDVTTTKTASETDLNDLALLIKNDLNADSTFNALYKASVPRDSNMICIQSLLVQTKREDSGDVTVAVTGTLAATLAYDTIKDRAIALALFPHPKDCSKGTISVVGNVGVIETGRPPKRILLHTSGGSPDMSIDGSGTAVTFKLSNNSDYDSSKDFLVTELRIEATSQTIGMGTNTFLKVAKLTNGVDVAIRSEGAVEYNEVLKLTDDIFHAFAFGGGSKYQREGGGSKYHREESSGADCLVAVFARPFYIRKTGSYSTDDDVTVIIQDDLSSGQIDRFQFSCVGFFED